VKPLTRFSRSFVGRMLMVAIALHAVLTSILMLGIQRIVAADIKDEFINHVRSEAREFGQSVEGKTTQSAIEDKLSDALLGGQVMFAELVLGDGGVIAPRLAAGRADETGSHPDFVEDFDFDEHDGDTYYIAVPIESSTPELSGMLHLGYDKQPVRERIRQLFQRGLTLVLAYFAVGLCLTWATAYFLSRPMSRLRDAARRIAEGQIDDELVVATRIAEVASLAGDLESMRRELVRGRRELHAMAYYDVLTGLGNRAFFQHCLKVALETARRHNEKFAILYMDLDRFKVINDTLGHDAGDELLRSVGKRLQHCLRASDVIGTMHDESVPSVARLGGDEFIVLLPGVADAAEAARVAQRIVDALCEPIEIASQAVHAATSIGIALYPLNGGDARTLIRNADAAMYHAKQCGSNRYAHYEGGINAA
jgi:diguanylate cyclase (GGDEF)-like protein